VFAAHGVGDVGAFVDEALGAVRGAVGDALASGAFALLLEAEARYANANATSLFAATVDADRSAATVRALSSADVVVGIATHMPTFAPTFLGDDDEEEVPIFTYLVYAIGALLVALVLCFVVNRVARKGARYKQYEATHHEETRMIRVRPAGGPPAADGRGLHTPRGAAPGPGLRASRVAPEYPV